MFDYTDTFTCDKTMLVICDSIIKKSNQRKQKKECFIPKKLENTSMSDPISGISPRESGTAALASLFLKSIIKGK